MAIHIDVDDPKHRNAAAEILRRHDNGEPEANITSVVRDFLIVTGLARSEEMVEENPPSGASRRAVDLTALDTFIEFKRRIGTASGGEPNPQYVEQLDDYLAQSASQGRVRMGILTDGSPGAGPAFTWLLGAHPTPAGLSAGQWRPGRLTRTVPVRKLVKHVWTYWGTVSRQLRPALAAQHRLGRPNPAQAVPPGGLSGDQFGVPGCDSRAEPPGTVGAAGVIR